MLTATEARQRCNINGVRLERWQREYRVTLNEWRGDDAKRKAYYTDDLEDAVLTGAAMRREATNLGK